MASHDRSNALSEPLDFARGESKGRVEGLCSSADDGIVVVVHFVYILRCADDTLYIGETADLERRIDKHQAGLAGAFTATRRPVALVYSEAHPTRTVALARERQLKKWTRAKKEALVAGEMALLKRL